MCLGKHRHLGDGVEVKDSEKIYICPLLLNLFRFVLILGEMSSIDSKSIIDTNKNTQENQKGEENAVKTNSFSALAAVHCAAL